MVVETLGVQSSLPFGVRVRVMVRVRVRVRLRLRLRLRVRRRLRLILGLWAGLGSGLHWHNLPCDPSQGIAEGGKEERIRACGAWAGKGQGMGRVR